MACVSPQEGRQGRPHGDGFYHPWPRDGDVQGRVGRPLHLTGEEGASRLGDLVSTNIPGRDEYSSNRIRVELSYFCHCHCFRKDC
jgi:hypothetical protein